MARPSTGANLNIAQLEQILNARRAEISLLEKQKSDLLHKLDGIDREMKRLGGDMSGSRVVIRGAGPRRGPGSRVRNEQSLPDTLEQVLRAAGKAMGVGDITDAVTAAGYRSNSANFRAIVNQTLIKERKRFSPVPNERGTYQLKK